MNKLVSIIIRTKNEERWISSCLRSVFRQSYKNIEVIIVDNKSTDHTIEKSKSFAVKIISIDEFFPGKAINDGIRASSGEYIVCLSAHCIPVNEFWLENLIQDIENQKVAGIYGRQEPLSFTSDIDKRDLLTVFGLDRKIQVKDSFFQNANSAFRKDIWQKYPFDENISNIEDRVWGEKVISEGLKIIYEPQASVYHWHGIHQDLNPDRAKNVVRILESLKSFKSADNNHQNPEDLNILAIIPVRGETLEFGNSTLLETTIDSAKKSKYISEIIVSTDSNETAEIARMHSIDTPFIRPAVLSEEFIDIFEVVKFTLERLEENSKHFDLVVLLEEIYPFRSDDLIDKMISQLLLKGQDTVMAAIEEKRSIWTQTDNKVKLLNTEEELLMPSSLKKSHSFIGMIGICCVTHPESIRSKSVLDDKVGIYQIHNPMSAMTIRKNIDNINANSMIKLWESYNEEGI